FFSSRRRHTRFSRDWSSDVCSSDLQPPAAGYSQDRSRVHFAGQRGRRRYPGDRGGDRAGAHAAPAGGGGGRGDRGAEAVPAVAEIGRASCRESVGGRGGAERGREER